MATLAPPVTRGTTPRVTGASGGHLMRKKRLFWPFVLPALALYVIFLVLPTVATVVLSFTKWAGAGDTPAFNGFTQYSQMWASDNFQSAFQNTLLLLFVGGIGTFLLAFLFTMVLRDMRGGRLVRAILFFPNIVAPVAIGMFFGLMFMPDKRGLANFVLDKFGVEAVPFLAQGSIVWVVMGAIMWASAGFYITILMAAVDRIPPYLYEDSDMAGASPWQKFWNVTLPMTWDVVGIAGVLWTINAIKIFELVFVLAGSGGYAPPPFSWTLGIYVFDRSVGANGTPNFGAACACAVMMILLVSVLVVLLRRLMRRDAIQF
ncbi:carbohydrate ABC transporter permease [Labedaea rhizosphaerae]|jgi:raffinose/stachyose/melibiose transport system permease protein|uniref:Carbohydrate ABC transporter membrane protein 1 (CUT1 family) n=1 Tax=Labedaea rhizosphaerae TaxID=598644 RepID=A0A4R6S5T8_LABRH|nr:sugar ABC transporter permease [Labedaea rhizosphaerae]TDP95110.1 carbohydrate ABC transporter membrane protein 1 (CUT1 family) [Labedaea rhizosphaerae]